MSGLDPVLGACLGNSLHLSKYLVLFVLTGGYLTRGSLSTYSVMQPKLPIYLTITQSFFAQYR